MVWVMLGTGCMGLDVGLTGWSHCVHGDAQGRYWIELEWKVRMIFGEATCVTVVKLISLAQSTTVSTLIARSFGHKVQGMQIRARWVGSGYAQLHRIALAAGKLEHYRAFALYYRSHDIQGFLHSLELSSNRPLVSRLVKTKLQSPSLPLSYPW